MNMVTIVLRHSYEAIAKNFPNFGEANDWHDTATVNAMIRFLTDFGHECGPLVNACDTLVH